MTDWRVEAIEKADKVYRLLSEAWLMPDNAIEAFVGEFGARASNGALPKEFGYVAKALTKMYASKL